MAEVAEPDICLHFAGLYSTLMYEQERPALPVAQEQTFSFAYGRGRKAGIHLQAQGEHNTQGSSAAV